MVEPSELQKEERIEAVVGEEKVAEGEEVIVEKKILFLFLLRKQKICSFPLISLISQRKTKEQEISKEVLLQK